MSLAYFSTADICNRYRCSSRTIFRRMQRKLNPFPKPAICHVGSNNLWDTKDVLAWEDRERTRTKALQINVFSCVGAAA